MKIKTRINPPYESRGKRMAIDRSGVEKILVFIEIAGRHPRRALVLVRIMPYRTLENRINGVVITFSNFTAAKRLEAQLRQTQAGTGKSKKEGTS